MPKVAIIQQVYNSRKWMELVYPAMVNQTFTDIEIYAQIVEDDGLPGKPEHERGSCLDYIRTNLPQIKILEPGYNIGFARGHNEIFASVNCEFFQLVNPDLILEPNYVAELVQKFENNPKLGAASGKLIKYDIAAQKKTNIIDSTGVVLWRNGRAADRGQNKKDDGQYDAKPEVIGVSGTGSMYRRAALEDIKMPKFSSVRWLVQDGHIISLPRAGAQLEKEQEYFDEGFLTYWEDVDLSLRLQGRGWQCACVASAVGYHGRIAASAEKDYADVAAYKKHHDALSGVVKQLNYKNHIFLTIKNFPRISWKFFAREMFMFAYLLLLERSTLKVMPVFFKQFSLMRKKRKFIAQHRKTLAWMRLVKPRGIVSIIDEEEGVNQSRTSIRHWVKEFFKLLRLVFRKR